MLGADRPVYATPAHSIRAAQAAADELDRLEGDERRCMTERVQQLIDKKPAVACQSPVRMMRILPPPPPRSRRDLPDADRRRPRPKRSRAGC